MFLLAVQLTQAQAEKLLVSNHKMLWLTIILGVIEAMVLIAVVAVLVHWAEKMVQFTDLMNELAREEKMFKSRVEEWSRDWGEDDPEEA